jgi:DNA-binding NtrC family response regulator
MLMLSCRGGPPLADLEAQAKGRTMARQLTFIVVEKSAKSQNAFRKFFEGLGFRVLISASPVRALTTVDNAKVKIDGLIFSSLELGDEAVDVFNSLADSELLAAMPAVLIVNHKNPAIIEAAKCDDYRKLVFIPMHVPSVTATLSEVLSKRPLAEPGDGGSVADGKPAEARPPVTNMTPSSISHRSFAADFDEDMPMPD